MLLVGLCLLAVAVHLLIRARPKAAVNACINNLRQIDGAIQQWALDHHADSTNIVTWNDILPYLGGGSQGIPKCPQGGVYTFARVADPPRCSIMRHNLSFGFVTVTDESGVPLADAQGFAVLLVVGQ